MSIKVIAGKFRGMTLRGIPKGKEHKELRPILARIKKSLFDIIRLDVPGAWFLDLFAGTGSVGIEALSRGAKRAVFVDSDFLAVKSLKEELERLGLRDDSTVFQRDIISIGLKWLSDMLGGKKFEIIFIGPPYKSIFVEKTLNNIKEAGLLNKNGIIIAQHHQTEKIPETGEFAGFEVYRREKYGDSILSFLRERTSDEHN